MKNCYVCWHHNSGSQSGLHRCSVYPQDGHACEPEQSRTLQMQTWLDSFSREAPQHGCWQTWGWWPTPGWWNRSVQSVICWENPLNNQQPRLKICWITSFFILLRGYNRAGTMVMKTLILDPSILSRPVRLLWAGIWSRPHFKVQGCLTTNHLSDFLKLLRTWVEHFRCHCPNHQFISSSQQKKKSETDIPAKYYLNIIFQAVLSMEALSSAAEMRGVKLAPDMTPRQPPWWRGQ